MRWLKKLAKAGAHCGMRLPRSARRSAIIGPTPLRRAAGQVLVLAALLAASALPLQAQPTLRDGLGVDFVRIPAGEFRMGSNESVAALALAFPNLPAEKQAERLAELIDEAPVHRVRITRPFWLGRTEVTVGQFRRFLLASGHLPESVADGTGGYGFDARRAGAPAGAPEARGDAFAGRDPRWSWADPGFAQGDDHPVVNVTFNDALAMARWLSRSEGRVYRLPTEAEWEYACRAGQSTRFQGGDEARSLQGAAKLFEQTSAADWPRWSAQAQPWRDGWRFTAPVASFAANAFGLHDMHGNVWEWVADRYDENYYARSPLDDPQGPDEGHLRVRRGGSWHSWPIYARCSYRNWNSEQTRYTLVGFRLLREADPAPR